MKAGGRSCPADRGLVSAISKDIVQISTMSNRPERTREWLLFPCEFNLSTRYVLHRLNSHLQKRTLEVFSPENPREGGMMKATSQFAVVVLLVLTGCSANHHSIYRHQSVEPPSVTTVDAKQRAILAAAPKSGSSVDILRFCAEPSPDVFAVIAQAVSGGASFGQSGDPKTIQAALSAAFSSSEQGSAIPRTQTTNMLREVMYRTCERYLSGGISDIELSLQAVRDQRLIVSILAIEQLTGVITPKPVVIGASTNGSSGSSGADAAIRLDDQNKVVQRKGDALKQQQATYDDLNGAAKDCEAIAKAVADKKEDGLSQALKDKRPKCESASTELDTVKKEKAIAEDHYTKLAGVATGGGVPVGVGSSVMVPVAGGGLDGGQSTAIAQVALAVKDIVAGTFNQDEFLFLCLKVLKGDDSLGKLGENCLAYIQSKVNLEQKRNEVATADIVSAAKAIQDRVDTLFNQFWSLISKDDELHPAKLEEVKKNIDAKDWPACFANAKSKLEFQTCFNSSDVVARQKRNLAKGSSKND